MFRYPGLILLLLPVCVMLVASQALAVDPAVFEAENRRIAVVEKLAPSVVAVFGAAGGGGGSGVLISPDGFALTNYHVTSGAGNFMKCGLSDGKLYDAVIVGFDPTGDLALIKLLGRDDFPTATLGDSDSVEIGDWAYVMGNPFLLATDFQPSVTYGIVSGVHRYQYPAGTFLEYTDCIQVDTSINPGNSGGPLFSDDGVLIGINGRASFAKRGRVNSGAGYAISINQAKNFMDHLRSGRIVDHGSLGATVRTDADGTARVAGILENSEAYRRGLRVDDEVVSFAGRSIRSVNQFKNILGIFPKGWKLPLIYRREGDRVEVSVRLAGLHRESEKIPGQRRRLRRPGKRRPKNPDDKNPQPIPQLPIFHEKPKPPEAFARLFVEKEGFANYYFNKVGQKRLEKQLDALGLYSQVLGRWKISGQIETGEAFEFILTDTAIALELGATPFYQALADDLVEEPAGSGGMLVAMHHLRLLLTRRGGGFTEYYYLGSEPLDGTGERVDVLVCVLTGVESRWYFSKKTQTLVGFDTRLSADVDASEIRFSDFRDFSGRKFPGQMLVTKAGRKFHSFRFEGVDMAKTPKTKTTNRKDQGKTKVQ